MEQCVAWHRGREGLPAPSPFSMAASPGLQAQLCLGLVLDGIWKLMTKGNHASWLMVLCRNRANAVVLDVPEVCAIVGAETLV